MASTLRVRIHAMGLASVVAVAGLIASPSPASAQPLSFTLDVSPRVGTTADTFVATVRLEVAGVSGPDRYWQPNMSDFKVIDRKEQHTTSTIHDANTGMQLRTSSIRRYILRPKQAGRFTIEPAKLRLGSDDFETRQVVVDVRDAGSASPYSRPINPDPTAGGGVGVPGFRRPTITGTPEMFIHAVVDKTDPFVGEQVTVTWLLYTKDPVLKFEPRPPSPVGWSYETLYEPHDRFSYYDDLVNGTSYQVAIVSKRAVFPTHSGKVPVSPYAADITSLNSSLGEPVMVSSPSLPLEVRPLPDGRPPDFDDTYVGKFSVEASIDRDELEAGESLTLTLTVTGEGAIRRTAEPDLKTGGFQFRAPRDFDERIDTSTDLVSGVRIYRYWATPEQGGKQTIPPLKIPYFNPHTLRYEIAQSEPIELVVKGDPQLLGADVSGSRENFILPDIRLIREGTSISSVTAPRMYRAVWYWLLAGLPLLAFLGVLVFDTMKSRMQKETPRARLRRARGRARTRFKAAEIHLRGNRPPKFFGELARVIYEYIEERVGQPVQSMTRPELREFLAAKGFSEETIQRVDDEIENCDFARFTPAASGPGEMKASSRRVRDLLKEIENTRIEGASSSEEAA